MSPEVIAVLIGAPITIVTALLAYSIRLAYLSGCVITLVNARLEMHDTSLTDHDERLRILERERRQTRGDGLSII